jgi:hypothetical protein
MVAGGINAAFNGGNIGQGMLMGGAIGGVMGAISGANPDHISEGSASAPHKSSLTVSNSEVEFTCGGKNDRLILVDEEPQYSASISNHQAKGEWGNYSHGGYTNEQGGYLWKGRPLSTNNIYSMMKSCGYDSSKFSTIRNWACESGVGGDRSFAARIGNMTGKQSFGASDQVWAWSQGGRSSWYYLPYSGINGLRGNPGYWIPY